MFKRTKGEVLGQPDWILFFTTMAIATHFVGGLSAGVFGHVLYLLFS